MNEAEYGLVALHEFPSSRRSFYTIQQVHLNLHHLLQFREYGESQNIVGIFPENSGGVTGVGPATHGGGRRQI